MLFEQIMLFLMFGGGSILVGVPLWKLVRKLCPPKIDPVAEAKEKFERAKSELEAARINEETEKLYSHVLDHIIKEDISRLK